MNSNEYAYAFVYVYTVQVYDVMALRDHFPEAGVGGSMGGEMGGVSALGGGPSLH